MLDQRLLRSDPDGVRAALSRRKDGVLPLVDEAVALDEERRALTARVEELRAERNSVSAEIAQSKARAKADPEAAAAGDRAIAAMRVLREELQGLEERLREVEARWTTAMLAIPNLPDPSAPEGGEDDFEIVKVVGGPLAFDFEPLDHMALAAGWIDTERGARTSGSRFSYLTGDAARLWLAINRYALDVLIGHGFSPVIPPVIVRGDAMYGTGFFPTDRQAVYRLDEPGEEGDERPDLYLVGTSEVPLAAFHQGEILDAAELPLRYCGISSCFRREAGAAGRDSRGIFRTHQFEKVEMFSFCAPERSSEEHALILSIEEEIAQGLGLSYRVINIAAGDLGGSAAKKYDIEAWLPGQGRYRELTSCSNCTDYQARRLQTRSRDGEAKPQIVHTLNGTAVTSSRTVIAVLESHQRADGTVVVPEVLQAHGAPAMIGPSVKA